jgi:hypothetical protein
LISCPEVEFLDEIQTKGFKVFLLVVVTSTALLEIYITSNSRSILQFLQFSYCTLKKKGGKPDRKPYPLPYGLGNPYRNLKSENSQVYAKKPQRAFTFMNSASGDKYL